MDRKEFLKRSDGVAFWLMFFICLALIVYLSITVQRVNYILLFLFIVGLVGAPFAYWIFAIERPLSVEVEKAERVAFWMMSLISLAVLALEYLATDFFDPYVFFVFVAGLLTKCVMVFFSYRVGR